MKMMLPIRTILAEPESTLRNHCGELTEHSDVEIVTECIDTTQLFSAILELKPDLVILDLKLPGEDLLQLMRRIPQQDKPTLLVAGSHEDAVRAFELHALDFLVKPVIAARFNEAVDRVRMQRLTLRDKSVAEGLLGLLAGAKQTPASAQRLAIKVQGRVLLLELDQIDWIEANGNYVKLRAGSELYSLREGIGKIAQRLNSGQFVRIHRSTIVNTRRIRELQPCNSGEYIVILKDGKELSCSRSYGSNLRQFILAQ